MFWWIAFAGWCSAEDGGSLSFVQAAGEGSVDSEIGKSWVIGSDMLIGSSRTSLRRPRPPTAGHHRAARAGVAGVEDLL